jgi:hypothetical protein
MGEQHEQSNEEYRLQSEADNRNSKNYEQEKGASKTEASDILIEEAGYTPEEKDQAQHRTYEVAERIRTAQEIDKQRSLIEKLGMKLGVTNRTSERDVAFTEATTENEAKDKAEMVKQAEAKERQEAADQRSSEAKAAERSRLYERNSEINTRSVELDQEILAQQEAMAECIRTEQDRIDGGRSTVYGVNPDGTPNTDPERRQQNSTGFVERYLTTIAEKKKEKLSLAEEHARNMTVIQSL